MELNRDGVRHVAMRFGLAFVMVWFGVHELHNPGEWTVFVPRFAADISPVSVNDLVLVHGFLLLLAGAAIAVGLFYWLGALLSVGLFIEIVFGLWYDGGLSDLVIRDIGLLALAIALAFDPSRAWHLENLFARSATPARADRRRAVRLGRAVWGARAPASAMASGAVLVGLVAGVAMALYGTGSGTAAPGSGDFALATSAPSPTPYATAAPATSGPTVSPAPASSAQATDVRFDSWQYKQYAYEIYPAQPNADAQKALAGFQLRVQDQGSSVLVQLTATSSRYHDASFSVDKANTAYFIETSFRDDPGDTQEQNLDDDGVIVVSPDGYLIKS